MVEASERVRSLKNDRPTWGRAISLTGWIESIQKRHESAVDELRKGIAAGDPQMTTRHLLWKSLIELGRSDELSQEIQSASQLTGLEADQDGLYAIDIAFKVEDYGRARDVALSAVNDHPEDPIVHLTYARVLMVIASRQKARTGSFSSESEANLITAKQEIQLAASLAKTIGG